MTDKKKKRVDKSGKKPSIKAKVKSKTIERRKKRGLKPVNPKSVDNLKPYQIRTGTKLPNKNKGVISMTHLLRKALAKPAPGSNRGKRERKTRAELVIKKILEFAISPRSEVAAPFIRMIMQRIDGKPADSDAASVVAQERAAIMQDIERAVFNLFPDDAKLRENFLQACGIEAVGVDEIHLDVDGSKTKQEADTKADALAFYQKLVNDKTAPAAVRLRAQERIDALLGHVKNESGPSNPEEQAEAIRNFLTALQQTGGAVKPDKTPDAPPGADGGGNASN